MSTYDKIGDFISNNKKVVEGIDAILCNGCDGKEKYTCAGCMKELAMINLIINYTENNKIK